LILAYILLLSGTSKENCYRSAEEVGKETEQLTKWMLDNCTLEEVDKMMPKLQLINIADEILKQSIPVGNT
jgi:penicillin V acylase-like amidase (Ntn superfamily)